MYNYADVCLKIGYVINVRQRLRTTSIILTHANVSDILAGVCGIEIYNFIRCVLHACVMRRIDGEVETQSDKATCRKRLFAQFQEQLRAIKMESTG